MDRFERAWYGNVLDSRLSQDREQAFEDFFCLLMKAVWGADFQPIKASGRAGDAKSDGYQNSTKTVFQCYAPPSGFRQAALLEKLDDFYGAKDKWEGRMNRWVFVHCDREGIPPYAKDKIDEISNEFPELELEVWGPQDIKSLSLTASSENLAGILGPAFCEADLKGLVPDTITELLKQMSGHASPQVTTIAPVAQYKLEFNKLGDDIETLLQAGRRKGQLVYELISRWPVPTYGDEMADLFREKYRALSASGQRPDQIFEGLRAFAGGLSSKPSDQVGALAILSYFFERCDIFENAPDGWVRE